MKNTSIWNNSNFHKIFWLSCILSVSQQFYTITIPLLIYQQSGSPISMGVARGIEYLPNIILAPLIGIFIDYVNTKLILTLSIIGQLLALITITIFFKYNIINNFFIYLMIFIFMTFNCAFNNIRTLLIKCSIDKTFLINANSNLQMAAQFIQVCTPTFSGILLVFSTLLDGLLVASIMILICLLIAIKMSISKDIENIGLKLTLTTIFVEPYLLLRKNKKLWRYSLIAMTVNVAEGASGIMYIFFFKSVLDFNTAMVGLYLSIIGCGAIIGGVLSPIIRKKFSDDLAMNICIIASAILYFLIFRSINLYIIAVAIFMQSLASMVISIYIWTVRQESTDSKILGRITGITSAMFKLGMPLGIPIAGIIASIYGVKFVFLLCTLIYLVAFVVNSSKIKKTSNL